MRISAPVTSTKKTARLYTDYSLLTADARITNEVRRVFNFIENPYRPVTFDYLMVSPQNSRRLLYEMIDREIANAQQGLPSGITLKLNNWSIKGWSTGYTPRRVRASSQSAGARYVLSYSATGRN